MRKKLRPENPFPFPQARHHHKQQASAPNRLYPTRSKSGAKSRRLRRATPCTRHQSKSGICQNPHQKRRSEAQWGTDELDFATYLIGALSDYLGLSQREVYRKLCHSGILQDYVVPAYPVLHTFGKRYLVADIEDLMHERGVLA